MFYRLLALLLLSPASVYAQDFGGINLKGLEGFVTQLSNGVVKSIAYMFLTLAVAAFFWGIVEYIWYKRRGDSEKTKIGQNFMLYGLLALFVMFSVWGIIKFAQNIIGIKDTNTIVIPSLEFRSSSSGTDGLTGASGQTGATGNLKFDACIAAGGGASECRILSGIVTGTGRGSQSGTTNTGSCSDLSSISLCTVTAGCKICNNKCVTSGTSCPGGTGTTNTGTGTDQACAGKANNDTCTLGIGLPGVCVQGTCTYPGND